MNPNENISKLAEDISKIKYDVTCSINYHYQEFYKVMRKHGIKQGTKTKNGVLCNNFEWSMAEDFFLACLKREMDLVYTFDELLPADLEHY